MNVKEIERRSALPRSVIRYYESEDLLHPQRLANGYRDYSEADLETLLKIKRLRELGASVAEIRAVQSGEAELSDVLGAALGRLGEQRGEVSESMAALSCTPARAGTICSRCRRPSRAGREPT